VIELGVHADRATASVAVRKKPELNPECRLFTVRIP